MQRRMPKAGYLAAVVAVALLPQFTSAAEIDVTGTWQGNVDCGSGIIGVTGWQLVEDTGTGVVLATLTDCGTVEFDGAIREFLACPTTPSPVPGLVSGTNFAVPASGYYDQGLLGFGAFASTTLPACTSLDSGEVEQSYTGVIQESGGVATRIDGFLGVGAYRLFNSDAMECASDTCGASCCTLVMLRNEIVIGTSQTVEPFEDASVTFDNVASNGIVAVTPLTEPEGIVPAEFQVSDLTLYYDVTTSAVVRGMIEVCLPYPDGNDDGLVDGTTPPIDETTLRLLHEEGGTFVDRTTSLDTTGNIVCATTDSLSQFVFGAATVSCGNGVVDVGEDCDEGLGANGDSTTCCTDTCTFRASGEVCRADAGECDGAAETCSGSGGACPADIVASAGTPCADDGNDCTVDECDGLGVCGTVAAVGSCDDGDACTVGDTCNGVSCVAGAEACGTEVAVPGRKLVVVDKLAKTGKGKVVFVAKDATISKGTGTDPGGISVGVEISYPSTAGEFTLTAGASDGTSGWIKNDAKLAKYLNKSAPDGPTQAKVAIVKQGKLLKLVAKGVGDESLDIVAGGAPSGDVIVVYSVLNGGELYRYCTAFGSCSYKSIAADTGAKLVCKGGSPSACPLPE